VDVKTSDGYIIRVFVIAFTKKDKKQVKKTSYAQTSQVKEIRKRIFDILNKQISKTNVNQLVQYLTGDQYTMEIEKSAKFIFPLNNVLIKKVKVLKRPKIDAVKLQEMYSHEKQARTAGTAKVDEEDDAANTLKVNNKKEKQTKEWFWYIIFVWKIVLIFNYFELNLFNT